jgi:L-malate glycosyltransferase
MKIVIVCFPAPGGSGIVATELGRELASRGHEIHIVSHQLPFRLADKGELFYHKVELKEYPLFPHPLFTLELAGKLVEVLKKFSPQIIHAHYALPNSISSLLAREVAGSSVKVITTIHGTDITIWGNDSSLHPLIRYSLEKSDAVSSVSKSLKEDAVKTLQLHEKDIKVIYNSIDTEKYKPAVDETLRRSVAPNGEKVILHLSNFRPVKRIPDLLQAFGQICRIDKGVVLLLAGDGVEKQRIISLSKEMGLDRNIKFVGTWIDPVPLFSIADLFVLPSEKESFGLAALEAMSCGVPVVASKTGGIPEVVQDGETGFLVPVGDIGSLSRAIMLLLKDDSLYRKFAFNSRNRAFQFATKIIVPLYEDLYKSLLP